MAFVGPHHGPKSLGKNHQSTTKVTLNEPPIIQIILNEFSNVKNYAILVILESVSFVFCVAEWCTEKTVGIQDITQWLLGNPPIDDFIARLVRPTSRRKLRTNKVG